MDSNNGISYYLNRCSSLSNTSQMTIFSFSKTVHGCIVSVTQDQLSEKCDFRVCPFCQVAHRHKLLEAA